MWYSLAITNGSDTYAHMWFDITNGSDTATANRDELEELMTTTQINIAKQLATECTAKEYKGC